jgi:hypothetical protein
MTTQALRDGYFCSLCFAPERPLEIGQPVADGKDSEITSRHGAGAAGCAATFLAFGFGAQTKGVAPLGLSDSAPNPGVMVLVFWGLPSSKSRSATPAFDYQLERCSQHGLNTPMEIVVDPQSGHLTNAGDVVHDCLFSDGWT